MLTFKYLFVGRFLLPVSDRVSKIQNFPQVLTLVKSGKENILRS